MSCVVSPCRKHCKRICKAASARIKHKVAIADTLQTCCLHFVILWKKTHYLRTDLALCLQLLLVLFRRCACAPISTAHIRLQCSTSCCCGRSLLSLLSRLPCVTCSHLWLQPLNKNTRMCNLHSCLPQRCA